MRLLVYHWMLWGSGLLASHGCSPKAFAPPQQRAAAAPPVQQQDTLLTSQRKLLKAYALCSCIVHAYPGDTALAADVSLSFYHEQSLYGERPLFAVDSAARRLAASIRPSAYPDYRGRKPAIYACMEFYHSQLLDSLVKTFDAEIAR